MFPQRSSAAFTLIELLVVIAIIAILAVGGSLLNPAQLLKQSRDSSRLSDAATIKSALSIYSEDVGGSLGSSSVVYISIPDPSATTTAGVKVPGSESPAHSELYLSLCRIEHFSECKWHWMASGELCLPPNLVLLSALFPWISLSMLPRRVIFIRTIRTAPEWETTMALESSKYAPTEASDGGPYAALYEQGTNLALGPSDFYSVATAGPLNGYAYERALTVSSSTSITSGTLSNFPMLINTSLASSETKDLNRRTYSESLHCPERRARAIPSSVFSLSRASARARSITRQEDSVPSTGAVTDWVNVPSLSAGTVIYACYGKSSVATHTKPSRRNVELKLYGSVSLPK